jgi:hypothetical protein
MHAPIKPLLVSGVLLSVLAAGCAQRATPAPMPTQAPAAPMERAVVGGRAASGAIPQPEAAPAQPAGDQALQPVGDRMIIRTADVGIEITDTAAAADQIKTIAESLGGYVASSNLFRSNDLLRGTISIRVPAEQFDTAMTRIKATGTKVEREQVSGQDVTEEYTDLTARRRNLEATEQELLKLLADVREKSGKAEDIMAVYRELTNIRGQIEQIQGRMQYLERLTALATINVELIPAEAAKPIVEPDWAPLSTFREASRALVRTFQGLVSLGIWFVIWFLPTLLVVLIPLAVIVWGLRRWLRVRARPAPES